MHTPAVSLKLKRFRRRFGITAPKMVVRTHVPWFWWFALAALFVLLVVALLNFFTGDARVSELREQLMVQRDELQKLRSSVGTGQSAVSMERAAQQQLMLRIADLERENAGLKEEIRLFERLVPGVHGKDDLRIEAFRLIPESPLRYRFRLLLAFQPGMPKQAFKGGYQIFATVRLEGRERQILVTEKPQTLEISHVLRREGAFEIPVGAVLLSAEVRVVQGATLRAKRIAQP